MYKKMKIFIKNMVCNRCIIAVDTVFKEAGYLPQSVTLGEVEIPDDIPPVELDNISKNLQELGFEIIEDTNKKIIEKIKNIIIEIVHYSDDDQKVNFSSVIESKLNKSYNYLSSLFSSIEGITIEHYIISQKIEKAKELLVYNELSLSEIAYKLGYSSVAHLSSQFKKVTGLTPTHFKEIGEKKRKAIDEVR